MQEIKQEKAILEAQEEATPESELVQSSDRKAEPIWPSEAEEADLGFYDFLRWANTSESKYKLRSLHFLENCLELIGTIDDKERTNPPHNKKSCSSHEKALTVITHIDLKFPIQFFPNI